MLNWFKQKPKTTVYFFSVTAPGSEPTKMRYAYGTLETVYDPATEDGLASITEMIASKMDAPRESVILTAFNRI